MDAPNLNGINAQGKTVLKKQLRRDSMLMFFVNLPLCCAGMEARIIGLVSCVVMVTMLKLMTLQLVKPSVKDETNAEGICEALIRTNMRFMSVKAEVYCRYIVHGTGKYVPRFVQRIWDRHLPRDSVRSQYTCRSSWKMRITVCRLPSDSCCRWLSVHLKLL